ncbi:hypothetical protein BRC90_05780 [Halobacteriales archaeon QS_4_69_34]|nr:MAG: hypothetical protein BRC90_05780 [Halobacteriales archaeon QS_4_69_34]
MATGPISTLKSGVSRVLPGKRVLVIGLVALMLVVAGCSGGGGDGGAADDGEGMTATETPGLEPATTAADGGDGGTGMADGGSNGTTVDPSDVSEEKGQAYELLVAGDKPNVTGLINLSVYNGSAGEPISFSVFGGKEGPNGTKYNINEEAATDNLSRFIVYTEGLNFTSLKPLSASVFGIDRGGNISGINDMGVSTDKSLKDLVTSIDKTSKHGIIVNMDEDPTTGEPVALNQGDEVVSIVDGDQNGDGVRDMYADEDPGNYTFYVSLNDAPEVAIANYTVNESSS